MICHKISAYQSPQGRQSRCRPSNNYGTRDGPNQWQRYKDGLVEQCGLTQSRIMPQIFYRLRKGSAFCRGEDDRRPQILHTRDKDG
jgi:hypothetical protein